MDQHADAGPLQKASIGPNGQLGKETVYTVPVHLLLPNGHVTQSHCDIGKICAEQLGNGDVTLFNYAFNAKTNPYQVVASKSVYQKQSNHDYKQIALNTYRYNLQGQLISTNRQSVQISTRNQYDALGRLVAVNKTSGQAESSQQSQYVYDINTNMTHKTQHGKTTYFVYNGLDQQTQAIGITQYYDQLGNQQTSLTGHSYQFNARYQLISEHSSTPSKTDTAYRYQYLPSGFRSAKITGALSNQHVLHYYYVGNNLLNTTNGQGSMSHYLIGSQRVDRFITSDETLKQRAHAKARALYYYLAGHNNTTDGKLSASNGTLQSAQTYTPYGQKLSTHVFHSPPKTTTLPYQLSTDPIGYDGEQQDPEDGLVYLHHRYYQPNGGRFLSPDSLGYALQENNRYVYSLADPINRVDPMGNMSLGKINNYLSDSSIGAVFMGQFFALLDKTRPAGMLFGLSALASFVSVSIAAITTHSSIQREGYILSAVSAFLGGLTVVYTPPFLSQSTTFALGAFLVNGFISVALPRILGQHMTHAQYAVAALYTLAATVTAKMITDESWLINVLRTDGGNNFNTYNLTIDDEMELKGTTTQTKEGKTVLFPNVYKSRGFGLYSAIIGSVRGAAFEAARLTATGGVSRHDILWGSLMGAARGLLIYNGSYAAIGALGEEGMSNKLLIASISSTSDFGLSRLEKQFFKGPTH